jgi:hypothetical protein
MSDFILKIKEILLNFSKLFEVLFERYMLFNDGTKIIINIIVIYILSLGITEIVKRLIFGLPKMIAFIVIIIVFMFIAYIYTK